MIENKVVASELITIDLKDYLPQEQPAFFDLSNFLYQGLILKEKDYRIALNDYDWKMYEQKIVLVYCSADVIIPVWAYMLATTYLQPVSKELFYGTETTWVEHTVVKNLLNINSKLFQDKRIVIKGCGDRFIPDVAYFEITKILLPVAKSIMYGEPCSTVPLFKRK